MISVSELDYKPNQFYTPLKIEIHQEYKRDSANDGSTSFKGLSFKLPENKSQNKGTQDVVDFQVAKKDLVSADSVAEFIEIEQINRQYSENFAQFKASKYISSLIDDFSYWQTNGTINSFHKIAEMRQSIDAHYKYFANSQEGKIFINTINLVLENNSWENINEKQLKVFVAEVNKFSDGEINQDRLRLFTKQIARLRFDILKKDESKKKT